MKQGVPSTNSSHFNHIGLIVKTNITPDLVTTLRDLSGHLDRRGICVYADEQGGRLLGMEGHDTSRLADICDLIIVVGGDGTLLSAARDMADREVPLLGINLGRLGFLVDISPASMIVTVDAVLAGEYEEDRRMLLSGEIAGQPPMLALNDVVLHKWNVARMIEFETWIDGNFVYTQRSDGLIISTPTGSTAYALSGGGPLLSPSLQAIALVPICPHTLSNRPIVIDAASTIEISVCGGTDPADVRITSDGAKILHIARGEKLTVRRHDTPVRLLHPVGHDHFNVLRAKLGWGELPKH